MSAGTMIDYVRFELMMSPTVSPIMVTCQLARPSDEVCEGDVTELDDLIMSIRVGAGESICTRSFRVYDIEVAPEKVRRFYSDLSVA